MGQKILLEEFLDRLSKRNKEQSSAIYIQEEAARTRVWLSRDTARKPGRMLLGHTADLAAYLLLSRYRGCEGSFSFAEIRNVYGDDAHTTIRTVACLTRAGLAHARWDEEKGLIVYDFIDYKTHRVELKPLLSHNA